MYFLLDTTGANLSDTQAVERLLRSTALAQDYQLPLAPHLAALSELLCKYYYYYFRLQTLFIELDSNKSFYQQSMINNNK